MLSWRVTPYSPALDTSIAVSPDGRSAMYSDGRYVQMIRLGRGAAPRRGVPFPADAPVWSPSRDVVLVQVRSAIVSFNFRSRRRGLITDDGYEPAFSPDGHRLAFVSTRDHYGEVVLGDEYQASAGEIYTTEYRGAAQRRVTMSRADDVRPFWITSSSLGYLSDRGAFTSDDFRSFYMSAGRPSRTAQLVAGSGAHQHLDAVAVRPGIRRRRCA